MKKICIRSLILGIGIGLILVASINLVLQSRSNPLLASQDELPSSSNLEKTLQDMKQGKNNANISSDEGISAEEPGNNINVPEEILEKKIDEVEEEMPPFEIRINKGMTSETIADLLLKNGVVDNRQEFIDLAIDLKMTKQFKYGLKQIPYGSSLKEIIEILTKID